MVEPAQPELTDGIVRLRPLKSDDAESIFIACQDPLIARFIPIPQPYTRDDAMAFVAQRLPGSDGDVETAFAITDAVSGELLGVVARHVPRGHVVSFGYWLAPWARGRGAMTRSLRLVVDWTLATTDLIRLELWTDALNDASGAVALRAGFEREGLRRAWAVARDGRMLDAVFYDRIRDPAAAEAD